MRHILAFCLLFPVVFVLSGCAQTQDLWLQDRALISDKVAKYAQLWDRKDAEEFSRLFAEDATMEWYLGDAEEQPPIVTGRSDILRYAKHAHTNRLAGRQSRHHFSGLVFEELSGTIARTEHMFVVTHVVPGEQPIVKATGLYQIEWEKIDGTWLMTYRKLLVDR